MSTGIKVAIGISVVAVLISAVGALGGDDAPQASPTATTTTVVEPVFDEIEPTLDAPTERSALVAATTEDEALPLEIRKAAFIQAVRDAAARGDILWAYENAPEEDILAVGYTVCEGIGNARVSYGDDPGLAALAMYAATTDNLDSQIEIDTYWFIAGSAVPSLCIEHNAFVTDMVEWAGSQGG